MLINTSVLIDESNVRRPPLTSAPMLALKPFPTADLEFASVWVSVLLSDGSEGPKKALVIFDDPRDQPVQAAEAHRASAHPVVG